MDLHVPIGAEPKESESASFAVRDPVLFRGCNTFFSGIVCAVGQVASLQKCGAEIHCLFAGVSHYICFCVFTLSAVRRRSGDFGGRGIVGSHSAEFVCQSRCYDLSCFNAAVLALTQREMEVAVHVILGLSTESRDEMLQTVDYVGCRSAKGVKLHMLHVLRRTVLGEAYFKAPCLCCLWRVYGFFR